MLDRFYKEGYSVGATDGIAGRVVDALFDDLSWTTVYVLLEVGQALTPRRVQHARHAGLYNPRPRRPDRPGRGPAYRRRELGERVVLSGLDRRTVREGPAFIAQEHWIG
jgi:hypothetical protein